MENQATSATSERIETTLGELIEAITQIALKASKNKEEGLQLASAAIQDILQKNRKANPGLIRQP